MMVNQSSFGSGYLIWFVVCGLLFFMFARDGYDIFVFFSLSVLGRSRGIECFD